MSIENRIQTLLRRHEEMDLQIRAEETRPFPDETLIHHLKREKLLLKDEMSELQAELDQVQAA